MGYFGEAMYKTPIIVGKSEEGPYIFHFFGRFPLLHYAQLFVRWSHPFCGHLLSEELNSVRQNLTLGCLRKDAPLSQSLE